MPASGISTKAESNREKSKQKDETPSRAPRLIITADVMTVTEMGRQACGSPQRRPWVSFDQFGFGNGCGSTTMASFWGRCTTHFRTYFSGWIESDVHWGYGLWIVTRGQIDGFHQFGWVLCHSFRKPSDTFFFPKDLCLDPQTAAIRVRIESPFGAFLFGFVPLFCGPKAEHRAQAGSNS